MLQTHRTEEGFWEMMGRLAWPEQQPVDGYGVKIGLGSVNCLLN